MVRDEFSVRQLVEQHKKRGEIAEGHPTEASLCVFFLQKGERDLQVAASNFEMGAKEKSPVLQSAFFNWVVVIGYYAMFHSARGALAKLSVRVSEDSVHEAVLNGMYYYYVYRGKMEEKLYFMLKTAKEKRDKAVKLVEKLESARSSRGNVNYEVAQAVKEAAAKSMLQDAKEFIEAMRQMIG